VSTEPLGFLVALSIYYCKIAIMRVAEECPHVSGNPSNGVKDDRGFPTVSLGTEKQPG
jgi:hypothetical protein